MKKLIHILLFLSTTLFSSEINNSLLGSSTGSVHGGVFTSTGWTTTSSYDAIEWEIETATYGKVSFDVSGLYASNYVFPNVGKNGDEDIHYTLFNMYDLDPENEWYGKWINGTRQWHNPYKMIAHIFGYTPGDQYKWKHGRFRLNVAAFHGGYDDDPNAFEIDYGPIEWVKDHFYHIDIEWGAGKFVYKIDGNIKVECDYSSFGKEYDPPHHALRLGSSLGCKGFGHQVPIGVTFKNFAFDRYEDKNAPSVVRYYPNKEECKLDEFISIVYDEPIKSFTASIDPPISGSFVVIGNAIVFEQKELMEKNTKYTVTAQASDAFGNTSEVRSINIATSDGYAMIVQKFGISEFVLKDRTDPIVFYGPSDSIKISCFDDGNWYKIRMAPTEIGTWTADINGERMSFECIESNLYHVKRSESNPYIFEKTTGKPWLWIGETSWRAFTSTIPFESRYKEYMDLRRSQGHTCVQSIVVSYINGDAFWSNEGGPAFDLSSGRKNYDKLNPDYYKWIDRRIEYANSIDIVPVIFITWAQEFVKFSNEQFKNYIEYLAARWSAYNIIWVISGEYNEVYSENNLSPEVWKQHGKTLYNADPYKHLISLHPSGRSSSKEFHDDSWFGFIMQQWPINYAQHITEDRQYDLPVVNAEYAYAGYHDNDDFRRGAWDIFTAGGFYTTGYYKTFAPDKGGYDIKANAAEQKAITVANNFIKSIPWWTMEPIGERKLSNGFELLYFSKNGDTVDPQDGVPVLIDTKTGTVSSGNGEHVIYVKQKDVFPPEKIGILHISE